MPIWFSGYVVVLIELCKLEVESSIHNCVVFVFLLFEVGHNLNGFATACKNCL